MGIVDTFALPDVGEGLTEAEVVTWLISVGDMVSINDPLVEIETDKSLVELPSPLAGRVEEILAPAGHTVPVGTPLVVIRPVDAPATSAPEEPAPPAPGATSQEPRPSVLVGYGPTAPTTRRRRLRNTPGGRQATTADPAAPPGAPRAKPPVRQLAKRLGVRLADLSAGPDGLVTREQVEEAAGGAGTTGVVSNAPVALPGSAPDISSSSHGETRTPVKGVHKAMAAAMVASASTAPQATLWLHADMTATLEVVERLRRDRAWSGVRVTPLLILAKAVLLAVRRHPLVNSSWDERSQEIVTRRTVNLGIAAATPRGLLVPNIKGADGMELRELAGALDGLVATAREGRTPAEDMAGGTLTITNVGVFGVEGATPILNPGEAAILAFGAARKVPWVVEDEIVIRAIAGLSISIDHRVLDGEQASRFLADVARLLEHPAEALLYA